MSAPTDKTPIPGTETARHAIGRVPAHYEYFLPAGPRGSSFPVRRSNPHLWAAIAGSTLEPSPDGGTQIKAPGKYYPPYLLVTDAPACSCGSANCRFGWEYCLATVHTLPAIDDEIVIRVFETAPLTVKFFDRRELDKMPGLFRKALYLDAVAELLEIGAVVLFPHGVSNDRGSLSMTFGPEKSIMNHAMFCGGRFIKGIEA